MSAKLSFCCRFLQSAGHEVIAAVSGESGIELALRTPPGVVLCDLHLSRIDGLAVIRWLVPPNRAILHGADRCPCKVANWRTGSVPST